MKSVLSAGWFGALILWLGVAATATESLPSPAAASATAPANGPRILAVDRHGTTLVIRVTVPEGVARVVLEACPRADLKGWVPRGVRRTSGEATEVSFEVAQAAATLELFRVRADATDPLPAAFYAGQTNFPGDPVSGDPSNVRNLNTPGAVDTTTEAGRDAAASRTVVESDIWAVRGDTLYFFNQYRGLQKIDITHPDAPQLVGTYVLPGAGEQMYVLDDRHVVLLARDTCYSAGIGSGAAVVVVDTGAPSPVEVARLSLTGSIVESRLVGTALYVASEAWEPVADGSGAWQSGTYVASFDLSNPAAPVANKPMWFPGAGNVVTATDRFLFVAVVDYSQSWPWKSDLQVVDITSPDGALNAFARIPLPGRVPDKFKIDLADDVLRVVVEAAETTASVRFVTVLGTWRLADPRAAGPIAYAPLGRLELARGERLFATRFDGNRAYVVTFQRIDPLWVVDLSDPVQPRIAGHVEIPGWSTFLRPLGDRLLTLGVDDARGSRVAVQLFDVSNPAKPALLSKVPLGDNASWSEANSDEKAFGIFPEAGLLLIPVSDWSGTSGAQGVQLVDLGRDALTKRGWLKSADVVPRRATLHQDRVLAVSGRRLVAADITDRDQPRPTATLELSFPVERVIVSGDYLVEFQAGGLRVQLAKDPDRPGTLLDLGELPVLGAAVRGGRLHVVQGRAAEIQWNQVSTNGDWSTTTNAGTLLFSVWDASALPALVRVGEMAKAPTLQTWLNDLRPLWLRDDLLVWSATTPRYSPWMLARGGAAIDVAVGPVGRFWMPWWGNTPRTLWAVTFGADGTPRLASEVQGTTDGSATGESLAAGLLVLGTRQRYESETTGTNYVVEKSWFPNEGTRKTNVVVEPDGGFRTNFVDVADGEWRVVTNAYPIVRWWSKYDLDVVDYSVDPASPMVRASVSIGGPLVGVSHGGAVLYTTPARTDEKGYRTTFLAADAYDGVELHRIDAIPIAEDAASETALVTFRDRDAYIARGGWATNSVQQVEAWVLPDAGKWSKKATAPLSSPPNEWVRFDDVLVSMGSSSVDLFSIGGAEPLVRLKATGRVGCLGGTLTRGDGNATSGVWLPLYDYGVVRLGP